MNFFSRWVDERFLLHRLRSTSIAGVSGGVLAIAIFEYRLVFQHVWSWDLLAVGITIAVVKLALMTWYSLTN
jgi:hypothetical protein